MLVCLQDSTTLGGFWQLYFELILVSTVVLMRPECSQSMVLMICPLVNTMLRELYLYIKYHSGLINHALVSLITLVRINEGHTLRINNYLVVLNTNTRQRFTIFRINNKSLSSLMIDWNITRPTVSWYFNQSFVIQEIC